MTTIQVNITTQVNKKSIRRESYNGREHLVLPSYTLPAGVVMNGGLYTAEQIDKHYQKLEGTLAPLGHPTVNGEFVSAFSPEGINVGHIGAWNRNVKKVGNRIYIEKWVDVEFAASTEGGRRLLERVEAIESGEDVTPIHTSVAAFLERLEPNSEQSKQGIQWVANIKDFDHDAILLDEVGAATPEKGVGLMVNADLATVLQPNEGALVGESYREREQRLDRAARERFGTADDEWVYVSDFTDSQVIIVGKNIGPRVYNYTQEGDKITFDGEGTPVVRQESWIVTTVNKIRDIFNPQARPASTKRQEEGDMPLTPEEKAELVKDIGEAVTNSVAEQLKPLTQKVDALEANHKALSDALTANSRAEEQAKRDAVAAKFGAEVAEGLTGNALEALYKQCQSAAGLAPNSSGAPATDQVGAPDPNTYFVGGDK